MLGGGAGFGGVDAEGLVGVAGDGQGFVVEGEVADQRVVEVLGAMSSRYGAHRVGFGRNGVLPDLRLDHAPSTF